MPVSATPKPPGLRQLLQARRDVAAARAKDWGKRRLRTLLELGQRGGVDILPRHFYSQIPDIKDLRSEDHWKRAYSMVGVDGSAPDSQVVFLRTVCPPELSAELLDLNVYADACARNGAVGYGPIEADFLYCFARTLKPRRVVQVGAGVATAVLLRASADGGFPLEIVCVEPYPTDFLRDAARAEAITLIASKAEAVAVELLTDLGDGDLLFVDSTHTVKVGSEVNRIILEVLQRLSKGVYVHFHDVLFPYDYSPDILGDELFFWNETVLLHAFLIGNARYTLRAALSMVHYERPGALRELIPTYEPRIHIDGLRSPAGDEGHFPSSAYLQVVA